MHLWEQWAEQGTLLFCGHRSTICTAPAGVTGDAGVRKDAGADMDTGMRGDAGRFAA